MQLRDYQIDLSNKVADKIKQFGLVYLAAQVRTGKSLIALNSCKILGAKKVIFITKKKAINSIESDYKSFGFGFELLVINKESLHKIDFNPDILIIDEAHTVGGSFPKPGIAAKAIKQKYNHLPIILMSGTPHPESESQIYHQFWLSKYSPFAAYTNFYKWAKEFVKVYQVNFGFGLVNQYEKADFEKIREIIEPYMITFTQQEAGFKSNIEEKILPITMQDKVYNLANKLMSDLVYTGDNGETIIADTAAKLMQKLHQIYSGTIKTESGKRIIFDTTKAEIIKDYFKGKRIVIFYKFIAEWELLNKVFGDSITNELTDFDSGTQNIALQIVSGREGINLSKADYIVYYNIDFSATSYWQSRDRMTTINRDYNVVYWVFGSKFERKIYETVQNKKTFTTKVFKQWQANIRQKSLTSTGVEDIRF